jgi:transposase
MIQWPSHTRVFLAVGGTDLRKAINRLSLLVEGALELDPFSGHLFVFCNRGRTRFSVFAKPAVPPQGGAE